MSQLKSNNPTVGKLLEVIYKLFRPFEKVNVFYLGCIGFFWIIMVGFIWLNAPTLIPTPMEVFKRLLEFFTTADFYNGLFTSILLTLKAMFFSLAIALFCAYLSVLPFFKPVAAFLMRLRFMSLVGLVFTFMLVIKGAGGVKLGLLMFGITPFFVLSLLSVIEKVGKNEYEFCQTQKMGRWAILYHLIIKGRADYTIETVRGNFAMAWLMITMVETFSMSSGGIGVMLYNANHLNHLDQIFALQIVIFGLGMTFDWFFTKIRYAFFPYVKLNEIK